VDHNEPIMQIVVGSQNPVKLEATRQAFNLYFDEVNIIPVAVKSGIHPFPMSQLETLTGALNRAQKAGISHSPAEYAVGIESGLMFIEDHYFVQAFAAVLKSNTIGLGTSVAFEVSSTFVAAIDPTTDKSKQTIDQLLKRSNLFQQEGVVGVLTQNRLNRTQILRDAVICALPRFLQPQYFPS
jgi:inosine/xanthosine triphosphatase